MFVAVSVYSVRLLHRSDPDSTTKPTRPILQRALECELPHVLMVCLGLVVDEFGLPPGQE